ncbi:MAG: Response regulator protein TmoT [Pseudomonadota bacterium]|jgi:FixJ family two-component response regulator
MGRGHVYLVDDNSDIRFHVGDLLQLLGYSVETFDGVEDFFRRALPVTPAVVLMDMRMPGPTGVEAHVRLQQLGRSTPVIYLSGESSSQEIIDAMKLGAVDFLLKPVDRKSMQAAIERGLELDRRLSQQRERLRQVMQGFDTLSWREKEVFPFLLRGMGNKQIGEVIGVQAGTIKKYRAAVFEKMGVQATDELIVLCQGLESHFHQADDRSS